MAVWRALERRRAGILSPVSAADRLRSSRVSRLELNVDVEIKSSHHGPITWLEIDTAEERYLLTGGADCTAAVYDLDGHGKKDVASSSSGSTTGSARIGASAARRRPREVRELARTPRVPLSQNSYSYGGHHHSVSVVRWYPVDTGLFISGGMDGVVKVWDTNTLAVVLAFDFTDKVYAAAMSAAAGQHHLVAVGNDSPQARLCDIRSGAFAHTLTGHSEAVWACAWSPRSEYLLATGSADHTTRLWDIRRSGASACLISLDQHREEGEDGDGDETEERGRRFGGKGATDGAGVGRGGSVSSGERGYWKHRKLAPHTSRASNFARAHAGPVNSLCFTPDGLHLLTSGTDNRLRLWQVETGRNTMTNYLDTKNRRRRPFGMAVAQPAGRRSETVFFPNDKSGDVLAFPLHSSDGRPTGKLRAHFDPVQCCTYRPRTQELVTCGADGLVLLWTAAAPPWASRASYLPSPVLGGGITRRLGQDAEDQDMWSSDDDAREGGAGGASAGAAAHAAAVVSGRGGRTSERGKRGRGGFVPPILMQKRRHGPGN